MRQQPLEQVCRHFGAPLTHQHFVCFFFTCMHFLWYLQPRLGRFVLPIGSAIWCASLSPTRGTEPLGASVTNIKWLCELFSSSRRFSSLCNLCPIDSIEEVLVVLFVPADDCEDVDSTALAPVPIATAAAVVALPGWWFCSRLLLLLLLCLYSGASCMRRACILSCLHCISLPLPLLRAYVCDTAWTLLYVCVWILCTRKFSLRKFLSPNPFAPHLVCCELLIAHLSTILFMCCSSLVFFLIELSHK